ncbi:hypothetical protein PVAG01_06834 [Phlyctema vagabunda]|uniref:Uncharacterized protein n=1 Tax=Phlyctema vagabunda TaxID=108571 RepID=A0ABR4PHF4_9HELO
MPSFREDASRYAAFEAQAQAGLPLSEEHLDLKVLEWRPGNRVGQLYRIDNLAKLAERPRCQLRVIFAPLDFPNRRTTKGLLALFENFNFPSSFLSERLQSVSHSFGSRQNEDHSQAYWFHYLCKNVNVELGPDGRPTIANPNIWEKAKILSHADFSWIRAGFYLTIQPDSANEKKTQMVTLVCFGASGEIERRFENIMLNSAWEDAMQDPLILFDVVFDQLYLQIDTIAWKLAEVYGSMETRILDRASRPGSAAETIDFVGLHNISKHVVYLREGAEAASKTLRKICEHHRSLVAEQPTSSFTKMQTQDSLEYTQTLLDSTQLRLISLEKRINNLINLAFNLVTQQDSRIMQKDSSSMKTIAIMTLIFLPAGTVAAMFGSQFFNLSVDDDTGTSAFVISPLFWIFWLISMTLTVILLCVWRLWHRRNKKKFIETRVPIERRDTELSANSSKNV